MRFEMAMRSADDTGQILIPINFQYQMSNAIYRRIQRRDRGYARMLRDRGAVHGYKSFKLFTFSRLRADDIKPADINGRKMLAVGSEHVRMTVSMVSERLFDILLWGNHKDRTLRLGDARLICNIYSMPEPRIGGALKLRTISPIVLSRKIYRKSALTGKFKEVYMSPDDPDYLEYLKRNIEEKFTAWKSALGEPVYSVERRMLRTGTIRSFKPVSKPRPSLTILKEGRRAETRVRGWSFDFEIEGHPEILEFAYRAGFGKMNPTGFGCVEII
ncbi:MAG: CRISPR-associated endoribonuclease Cas6 [Ignavibacteriae bacterium]|nr:CRISPR-associated endoribonuclease Cas6 [Ignavibacteriota bacterium]MCB9244552.1 CRISPR-associated endoribonuclease Cas6 [Ignavibacteriales bacterium]